MANSERLNDDDEDGRNPSGDLDRLSTDWRLQLGFFSGSGITPTPGATISRNELDVPRDIPFPPNNHKDILPDNIEELRTSPLDHAPSGEPIIRNPQRESRYYDPGAPRDGRNVPGGTPSRPIPPEESVPMYSRRNDDVLGGSGLTQRRAEDERRTGRHWPGNNLSYPGSPYEAMYFEDLAVALGHVDPQILTREGALRYVRSAVIPGEDSLGPTDIYAILYYGLGLTVRPLNCTGVPHILAVYNRESRDVYIDWTIVNDAPIGRSFFEASGWRRAVDASPLARFLLSWCCAVHISDNYDVPLVIGFTPVNSAAPGSRPAGVPLSALEPDTLNRYRKTLMATASLLAPAERLWQQISAYRVRIHMGDPEWRARLRAEFGFQGWRGTNGPAAGFSVDPVDQLLDSLAEQNRCPRFLIEAQLDGNTGQLDWDVWSMHLMQQLPDLQQRYVAAAQMFRMSGQNQNWAGTARTTDSPPVQMRLSL